MKATGNLLSLKKITDTATPTGRMVTQLPSMESNETASVSGGNNKQSTVIPSQAITLSGKTKDHACKKSGATKTFSMRRIFPHKRDRGYFPHKRDRGYFPHKRDRGYSSHTNAIARSKTRQTQLGHIWTHWNDT